MDRLIFTPAELSTEQDRFLRERVQVIAKRINTLALKQESSHEYSIEIKCSIEHGHFTVDPASLWLPPHSHKKVENILREEFNKSGWETLECRLHMVGSNDVRVIVKFCEKTGNPYR